MNFIEAVESGRRLKRKSSDEWLFFRQADENHPCPYIEVLRDDILASDWEVEEKRKPYVHFCSGG